jgi:hypothetical protein
MTDEQIRAVAKKEMNGSYMDKICRRCGSFWLSPEGNTDECAIVDKCQECFDKPNGDPND